MQDVAVKSSSTEEAAHLSLELGRLLLTNGADTAQVHDAVARLASRLDFRAHLIISYEAMLVTVDVKRSSHTRVGRRIPPTVVDMTAVETLNQIADETAGEALNCNSAHARLAALEQNRPLYPHWLIAPMIGLSAASLSRLFGGDWSVFLVVYIAAMLGTLVRQQLGRWHLNPFAVPFLTALVSGLIGGIGMRLHPSNTQYLSLIAPGIILVPGAPLINGIRDAISNNIGMACAKLTFVSLVILAIALGLFTATILTSVGIPVVGATISLSLPKDALHSAIATLGSVFVFNVRPRVAWACILCGLCGHTLRTTVMHLGVDIVTATLIASLATGAVAHLFANGYRVPAATFAFPGVLAMVPGAYAFRAVIGLLEIRKAAGASPVVLQAETLSLVVTTILLTTVIAVGLAIPLAIPTKSRRGPSPFPVRKQPC